MPRESEIAGDGRPLEPSANEGGGERTSPAGRPSRTLGAALVRRVARHGTLARFSAASSAHAFTGMVAGFVVLRWVPPSEMGVWQSLLIVQAWAGIVQAGVTHGLNRELPFRLGASDESGKRLAESAQAFALIGMAVLIGAAGIWFLLARDAVIRQSAPAVLVVAGVSVYTNFLAVTFRADQAFDRLAGVNAGLAVLNVGTLPIVFLMGYPGVPLRALLLAIVQGAATHACRPMRLPLRLDGRDIRELMAVGVPLFAAGWLIAVAGTFPKTILLWVAGPTTVGIYAPAAAMQAVIALLPASLAQYVYARMAFHLGRENDLNALWRHAWRASLGCLASVAPLVAAIVLVFPWIAARAFPSYAGAGPAVIWTSVAGAFFSSSMYSSALNSLKAWRWIGVTTGFRVAACFAIPLGFVRQWPADPLVAVSSGFCAASALTFVVGLVCTYRATHPAPSVGVGVGDARRP